MRAARILCILLVGLLLGCDSEPPDAATAEQAVYESFFEVVAGEGNPLLFLAAATENDWFKANPFEEGEWDDYLDDLGGIPIDLVEELYRVNRDSVPIGKNPRPANVEFLPARSGGEERCLVGEDEPHIGVRSQGGYYRAYYTVSRVAFSQDRTHALLKYSRHCAPLSGGGEFFAAFRLEGQQWQVIGGRMLWIS